MFVSYVFIGLKGTEGGGRREGGKDSGKEGRLGRFTQRTRQ